jgi:hypothetical protein
MAWPTGFSSTRAKNGINGNLVVEDERFELLSRSPLTKGQSADSPSRR